MLTKFISQLWAHVEQPEMDTHYLMCSKGKISRYGTTYLGLMPQPLEFKTRMKGSP